MKLPLSWLNDYVKVDDIDPKELAEKLTRAGLQVESIDTVGGDPLLLRPERVLRGRVLSAGSRVRRLAVEAHGVEARHLDPGLLPLPGGLRLGVRRGL